MTPYFRQRINIYNLVKTLTFILGVMVQMYMEKGDTRQHLC